MNASIITRVSSSPAPKEWCEIPIIKEQRPKRGFVETSLQLLDGTKNCVQWMGAKDGVWWPVGDVFVVYKGQFPNSYKPIK